MGLRDDLTLAEAAGPNAASNLGGKGILSRGQLVMSWVAGESTKWGDHVLLLCAGLREVIVSRLGRSCNAILLRCKVHAGRSFAELYAGLRSFARVHTQISSPPDLLTIARVRV